jgi:hypothetical protein
MQTKFEAPELMVIGCANEVVMGASGGTNDLPLAFPVDFEFEQDSL